MPVIITKKDDHGNELYTVAAPDLQTAFEKAIDNEVTVEFGSTIEEHSGEQTLFEASGHPEDDPQAPKDYDGGL